MTSGRVTGSKRAGDSVVDEDIEHGKLRESKPTEAFENCDFSIPEIDEMAVN